MSARRWIFATGVVTLWGQVVLLRELLVAFYGRELVVLLALSALMLFTAAGALLGRRFGRAGDGGVRVLFVVFAAVLPALLVLLRALRVLLGGTPGADLPFGEQLLGLGLTLLPFGLLAGLLFQRAAVLCVAGGASPGRAYAIESIGSLAGGLLATGLVAIGVQNAAGALLCSCVAVAAAWIPGEARSRWIGAAVVPLALLLGAGLACSRAADRWLTGLNLPGVLAVDDTPYGRTAVAGRLGQVVVFHNGALASESQGTSAEEFVHLPALECPTPRRVLSLGGTVEGLVREVLKHGPERVDLVELDRDAVDLVRPFLPQGDREALVDARVTRTVEDPRRFLGRAGTYDLILSAAPEPGSGESNRFYTREFFALCRRHLAESGVLAFRLRSSENLWSNALAARNESVLKALRAAFPSVLVLPGTADLVLASARPLQRDPAMLIGRWKARGVEARLTGPDYIAYLLTNDRLAKAEQTLARTRAPENTDARPACYPCTMLLWLSRFFPSLGNASPPLSLPWIWLAFPPVLLAAAAGLARRSEAAKRALFVAAAGFSGMVLEGTLLLAYQTRCGALFQDLGALLMCFMGGLSLGAWCLDRLGSGRGSGLAIALLAAIVSIGCAWAVSGGDSLGRGGTGLLLLASGAIVGASFAWAGGSPRKDRSETVAALYAADLAGGCLGALLGGVLYLPFAGLPASAGLAALTGLVMVLLL